MQSGALDRLRKQIRLRLKEKGARQGELATYLGKSSGWMTMVLQGKRGIHLDFVDQIAAFFQVPPSVLLIDPDMERALSRETIEAPHAQARPLKRSARPEHDLIARQQLILERQQVIIDHALSHLRPLISVLETVADFQFPREADRRTTPSPRTVVPKRRRPRSANGG